jgi:AcrR family transcriptional regulator
MLMLAAARVPAPERVPARHDARDAKGGGAYVSVLQRTRLLEATVSLVSELGVRLLTVRRVTARAGMSSKTFYDLFEDREDCLLSAFDHAVEKLCTVALPAYRAKDEWAERVRAGLAAVLMFLDGEPELRRFVFVEALAGGPRVLERRARLLEDLAGIIDGARKGTIGQEPPPLTAEGVVGAACSVIHARLLEPDPSPLVGLLSPLMATIVLPYRGQGAASRELQIGEAGSSRLRPADKSCVKGPATRRSVSPAELRPTLRTFAVLESIAEQPGMNNREVSDRAGISDQGQISRLLWRLEDQGLVQNAGGHEQGTPKAWSLTSHGEQALHATRPHEARSNDDGPVGRSV